MVSVGSVCCDSLSADESGDVELTRPTEEGRIANAPLLPDQQTTTLLQLSHLQTADPADIELQMELARKFGKCLCPHPIFTTTDPALLLRLFFFKHLGLKHGASIAHLSVIKLHEHLTGAFMRFTLMVHSYYQAFN